MKSSFLRRAMTPVMLAGLFGSASAFAATVDLAGALNNPSFELGNQGSGCPVGWVCGGSPSPGFTSYAPTSAQFNAGTDGIGRVVPAGSFVGSAPTPVEGSGTLFQATSLTYTAGNTYTLSFWLGTPLTEPDGTTPTGPVQTFAIQFLDSTGAIQYDRIDYVAPAAGKWVLETASFDPTGTLAVGQNVGIQFFVVSGGNDLKANIDIGTTSSTPEPASLLLGGLGIVGLGLLRRKRAA